MNVLKIFFSVINSKLYAVQNQCQISFELITVHFFCSTLFNYTQIISPNRVNSIWRNVDRFYLPSLTTPTTPNSSFRKVGMPSRSRTCQRTSQRCSKTALGVTTSHRIQCGICLPPASYTLIRGRRRLRQNSWHVPLPHLKRFTLMTPVKTVRFYFLQFHKLVYFILSIFSTNVCKICFTLLYFSKFLILTNSKLFSKCFFSLLNFHTVIYVSQQNTFQIYLRVTNKCKTDKGLIYSYIHISLI